MVSVRMVGSVRISCLRGAKSLGIEARHGAGSAVAQAHGPFGLVVAATMMLALTLSMALATPAAAKPKYAALVLDKYSGRVLFSRHADAHRYPASLTKIMTLYIVFEELAKENITLDTKFTVSRHAAGQAPSKLGLDAGDTITVENAILALVTKSANDVAMVVAENIGGSERKFAQQMTKRARELGMARTTFRNPHGLPDKRQVTTARDMATLAQRIMDDFPQYYSYFGTESFTFRGRTFNNHNNLLGDYEGTNGIKTGYTRASGFNLTASVTRDGKHLVGVVMGGKTPRTRDDHMREILDEAFGRVPTRGRISIASAAPIPRARPSVTLPTAEPPQLMASLEAPRAPTNAPSVKPADAFDAATAAALLAEPAPARRPAVTFNAPTPDAVAPTAASPETASGLRGPTTEPEAPARQVAAAAVAPRVFDDVSAWLVSPANARESAPRLAGTLTDPGRPTGAGDISSATDVNLAALNDPGSYSTVSAGHAWRIQIGAYSDATEAGRRIQAAMARAPSVLKGKGPATVPVRTASRTLFRSRFTGFDGEDQARNACTRLIREGISCITVPPDDWYAPTTN